MPRAHLWTVVVLIRKLLLVLAVCLLHHRPEASMRVAVAVLLIALGLHGVVQPFIWRRPSQRYAVKWYVLSGAHVSCGWGLIGVA